MSASPAAVSVAAGAVTVAYVLVGYPLLLGLRARRGRPIRRGPELPTVSVVIAVRNGEHYIGRKLESVLALDYPRERLEVIVASDGSTDGTERTAGEFAARGVRVVAIPPGGKGAALNAGVAAASGEILLLTDVRQPVEPGSLRHLVSNFADPAVGVVSGELLIGAGASEGARTVGLYWRYESWIRDRLSQLDSMFGATGPFYAMRRALFVPLPADVLLDDMYLPLSAFFRGYRLVCDPRARAYDVPTSARTEFTRKVRTLAGNYQILRFYPQLLGPRNRLLGDYLSYKLGRLLLPFALLAMLVGGALLPAPWRLPVLAPQLAGYGLALLDRVVPEGATLKRLTAPAATFVTMMAAALGALSIFVVPPRRLWKVTSASAPQALDA